MSSANYQLNGKYHNPLVAAFSHIDSKIDSQLSLHVQQQVFKGTLE